MNPFIKSCKRVLLLACIFPLLSHASTIAPQSSESRELKYGGSCCDSSINILSSSGKNTSLDSGNYLFGSFQNSYDRSFDNKWTFTLAESSQVQLNILEFSTSQETRKRTASRNFTNTNSGIRLELFDNNNKSLGYVNNYSSLNLMLAANTNYSFVVTGASVRKLREFFIGNMQICPPTSVPLGDSLPMFTASLLVLSFRLLKRYRQA